jgi:hypothetical protein
LPTAEKLKIIWSTEKKKMPTKQKNFEIVRLKCNKEEEEIVDG